MAVSGTPLSRPRATVETSQSPDRPPTCSELETETRDRLGVMGTSQSKPDPKTPLGCLLANFTALGFSQDLRRRRLIFYPTVAWPQYPLDNRSKWPPEGTFDFNILCDLDNYCRRTGEWSEVPYVQAFCYYLCSRPSLCVDCSTSQILLAKQTSPTFKPLISFDDDPSPPANPPESPTSPPSRAPLQPPPYPEAVPPPPEPALAPPTAPPPTLNGFSSHALCFALTTPKIQMPSEGGSRSGLEFMFPPRSLSNRKAIRLLFCRLFPLHQRISLPLSNLRSNLARHLCDPIF
ncbi:natural cytotoxicity triggering receptor 3 ligand 1-like [Neophocaena asiaeorientalis asiaeorientalis]|uniref:Natural cytotoxicity triggering receptor 3 ligand 1-like n=1 Tax=Neophocaena asiaeorientalis asiaeorientalis TaxID=1706337 RepID=A0A341CR19_NEOAA|nr:natural cytotoxicity triggering receptor 3 ligand 1-like [Neophocaena asiaeorientalis asiaeorientalis]